MTADRADSRPDHQGPAPAHVTRGELALQLTTLTAFVAATLGLTGAFLFDMQPSAIWQPVSLAPPLAGCCVAVSLLLSSLALYAIRRREDHQRRIVP